MVENKYQTSFTVHVKGDETEESFDGVFKVKTRLSFREQLARDEFRRQFLGSSPAGTEAYGRAANVAEIYSELAIRILDAPKWWVSADNGMALYDENVLMAVYNQCMTIEKEASKKTTTEGEKAKADVAAVAPKE